MSSQSNQPAPTNSGSLIRKLLNAVDAAKNDPTKRKCCELGTITALVTQMMQEMAYHYTDDFSGISVEMSADTLANNLDAIYRARECLVDATDRNVTDRDFLEWRAGEVTREASRLLDMLSECPEFKSVYHSSSNQFTGNCGLLIPDFAALTEELIAYFGSHPEKLYELEPRKFEELLDAIFRNLGYDTEIGPGWGDGGVDIRIYGKDLVGEVATLVQAKRYRIDNPIRIDAVAALAKHVDVENANRGLFVTTSRYLPSTRTFAEKCGHTLVLADSSDVARWCTQALARDT